MDIPKIPLKLSYSKKLSIICKYSGFGYSKPILISTINKRDLFVDSQALHLFYFSFLLFLL